MIGNVSFGGNLAIHGAKVHKIGNVFYGQSVTPSYQEIGKFVNMIKTGNEKGNTDLEYGDQSLNIPTDNIRKIYKGSDGAHYISFDKDNKKSTEFGDSLISFKTVGNVDPNTAYTAACQNSKVNIVV